jgi:ABC-type nickel/cobalt efflux system permease component RcnA
MDGDLGLLLVTAASIGFIHTLLGPDHYLPFVAMGAARRWSTRRTLWITGLCGVGHVLGSVLIGIVGIVVGLSVTRLEWFEGLRGDAAAWLLTGFGLAYLAWGLKKAWRSRAHTHPHFHGNGTLHEHDHGHEGPHLHPHVQPLAPPRAQGHGHRHVPGHPHPHLAPATARSITPWALFVIFVLGPCEPLIPVLMYPAAQHSVWGTVAVVLAFGAATLVTMLVVVYLGLRGLERLPLDSAERYSHALAGAALTACGLGIVFLGL